MPFNIGQPFSPAYLSLIQNERERRDRKEARGGDDAFRRAQLQANVGQSNADRDLKIQMANAQFQIQNARTQDERDFAESQFAEMQRQFDDRQGLARETQQFNAEERDRTYQEGVRRFDVGAEETARHNIASEDTAARRAESYEDRSTLMREKEFGDPDATYVPGSLGAQRAARTKLTGANASLAQKRAEEVTLRLEGKLPSQILEKEQWEHRQQFYGLAERAQSLKETTQVARLVMDFMEMNRDLFTGEFQAPQVQVLTESANALLSLIEDDGMRGMMEKILQDQVGKAINDAHAGSAKKRAEGVPARQPKPAGARSQAGSAFGD